MAFPAFPILTSKYTGLSPNFLSIIDASRIVVNKKNSSFFAYDSSFIGVVGSNSTAAGDRSILSVISVRMEINSLARYETPDKKEKLIFSMLKTKLRITLVFGSIFLPKDML